MILYHLIFNSWVNVHDLQMYKKTKKVNACINMTIYFRKMFLCFQIFLCFVIAAIVNTDFEIVRFY